MSFLDELDEDTAKKIKTILFGGIGIVIVIAAVYFIFDYLVESDQERRHGGPKQQERGMQQERYQRSPNDGFR
jgi:hypothetical protein